MDMDELVRTIACEVLKQLRAGEAKPCVMVLENRDRQLDARVRECLGEDVDVLFFGEDAAGRTPARHILPCLSCGDMADLANGKASGPFMDSTLRLLLTGVPVETMEFEYHAYAKTAPDALYNLYASYEKRLAAYGLTALRSKQPDALRLREDLVTEKIVLEAHQAGASTLWVPLTAKVTPLAAETARNMHLNILKRL